MIPSIYIIEQNSFVINFFGYPIPLFSKAFYIKQIVGLCLSAVCFLWLFHDGQLDFAISHFWFDAVSQRFVFKDNFWVTTINHSFLKYLIIFIGGGCLFWGGYKKKFFYVALTFLALLSVGVVALLKQVSIHSCPWDLTEFGGSAVFSPLFSSTIENTNLGTGKCFPGGHASAGFCLMIFFFVFYLKHPGLAKICWLLSVLLGLVMGFGQVVRGAHLFSHNLWSGWFVWASLLFFYWVTTQMWLFINSSKSCSNPRSSLSR